MRTTIDLPDDLHRLARQIAHEENRSMSDVIAELIRRGISQGTGDVATGVRGLPVVRIGRAVTSEDVRSLDDE